MLLYAVFTSCLHEAGSLRHSATSAAGNCPADAHIHIAGWT